MKVSEIWLREWVNPELSSEQLAAVLTMAGLEVDSLSPVCGDFSEVYVAQVVATKPHPQADKLTLCEVDAGNGQILQVVCGAANVRTDLKVALARIGAKLPNGLVIKEAKLRGELSQGMLCSASELGLADNSEGIIELDDDAPIGMDVHEYLSLNDTVIDIDLTPNRADCFSVLGVAREAAALTKSKLTPLKLKECEPQIDEQIQVTLKAKEACPQYYGRLIRGVNSHVDTPLRLRERLRRAGLRPIHPVVDVMNYVMLELGQPMHAFDAEQVSGQIIVRYSKEGESLQLLGGETITLNENHLLIADDKKPLALAGIMGGEQSAVNENTRDIFLESAFFSPKAIAGVARHYGLCTDSSQRFERGVDSKLQKTAIERATELLLDIVGGSAGPVVCVTDAANMPESKLVLFNPSRVKKLTGLELPEQEMLAMLERLGMNVSAQAKQYQVSVPSHRFDIHIEEDLVEEVVRLFGYDKIPGEAMVAPVKPGKIHPLEVMTLSMSKFMVNRGYHETISYSFVDPQLQALLYSNQEVLDLVNPISPELSQMRLGLWSGLLASMVHNVHRQQTSVKLYESGVAFERLSGGEIHEHPCFSGLVTGLRGELNWLETTRDFDFFDVKGDLQALFAGLNLSQIQWVAKEHLALHPGKSAQLMIGERVVGWCGVLHPRIAEELDLAYEVVLFELYLNALQDIQSPHYHAISKYPQIRRDLALLADEAISAFEVECVVRQAMQSPWLKAFNVFDVYQGEKIPKGKKSMAIALTLQDEKRTLQDNEINLQIDAILKKLNEKLKITLRE